MIYLAVRLRLSHLGTIFWLVIFTVICTVVLYVNYGVNAAAVLVVHFVGLVIFTVRGASDG